LSFGYVKEFSITHKTTLEHPRASELDLSLLFDALKSLEVLRVHSCLSTDSHHILSPFDDSRICPSLRTVEIVHCSRQIQWLSALLHMARRRWEAGLTLRKVLVSPHPGVDSPTQGYIKELNVVLLEPFKADGV
jgi:hypothetical protein